jgi:capsid protein
VRLFTAFGKTVTYGNSRGSIGDAFKGWAGKFFNTPSATNQFVNPPSRGISILDGNKYVGGLGAPTFLFTDYWALRLHSAKLFKENLYARGLIRRLVTNEVNKGLSLEAIPDNNILDIGEDFKNDWSEKVESRFQIWGKNPQVCDHMKRNTFGALQRICRAEALVTGDVLVVLHQNQRTKLPAIELVSGHLVQTPLAANPRRGNKIVHGVEMDSNKRHVAFWIMQQDGTSKRLSAFGDRSKRRVAWLVYGTDKRLDDVRGEPILSLVMQSLKEVDRYRDAVQRKAVLNSVLAMFIKKTSDKPGTKPLTGGAVRLDQAALSNPDGSTRQFNLAGQIPGLILEELQEGEEPKAYDSSNTDINFAAFEAAIINAFAWANEIPPGILTLAFQSNYSASRGEVKEFTMYLDKSRSERADEFDEPIYQEWLISEVLIGKVIAPGLLEAWRDPLQHDIFGAWVLSDWSGAIKPNVDMKKEVDAYVKMINAGLITLARAARELNGMKFTRLIKQLKIENELKADALRPLLELQREFGVELVKPVGASANDNILEMVRDTAEETALEVIEGGQ